MYASGKWFLLFHDNPISMKFLLPFFAFCFFAQISFAQHKTDPVISAQIDQQVWKPFQAAYRNSDGEAMVNLHTDDVLRVTPWGIKLGETYRKSTLESYSKPDRGQRSIDFRFEHRIHEGEVGYEVGYYKVVVDQPDGTQTTSFGRFHIVLKKIEDVWKIAQDWDTSTINGLKVTSDDFEKLAVWN